MFLTKSFEAPFHIYDDVSVVRDEMRWKRIIKISCNILFHYADEIKCIKNVYMSLRSFFFRLYGYINLCTEILFPMGSTKHFTVPKSI